LEAIQSARKSKKGLHGLRNGPGGEIRSRAHGDPGPVAPTVGALTGPYCSASGTGSTDPSSNGFVVGYGRRTGWECQHPPVQPTRECVEE